MIIKSKNLIAYWLVLHSQKTQKEPKSVKVKETNEKPNNGESTESTRGKQKCSWKCFCACIKIREECLSLGASYFNEQH